VLRIQLGSYAPNSLGSTLTIIPSVVDSISQSLPNLATFELLRRTLPGPLYSQNRTEPPFCESDQPCCEWDQTSKLTPWKYPTAPLCPVAWHFHHPSCVWHRYWHHLPQWDYVQWNPRSQKATSGRAPNRTLPQGQQTSLTHSKHFSGENSFWQSRLPDYPQPLKSSNY
jgi:hypothetical protein